MTELKFDKYTLWVNWKNKGWHPYIVCLNLPFPAENPRWFLKKWAENSFLSKYWDKKNWMILGGDKKPAALKKSE